MEVFHLVRNLSPELASLKGELVINWKIPEGQNPSPFLPTPSVVSAIRTA